MRSTRASSASASTRTSSAIVFFTPEDAVGYGLIDRVLQDRGAAETRRVMAGLAR